MSQQPNPGFICPPASGELVATAQQTVLQLCPKCGGRMDRHSFLQPVIGQAGVGIFAAAPVNKSHTMEMCPDPGCVWLTCRTCRLTVDGRQGRGRVRPMGSWTYS